MKQEEERETDRVSEEVIFSNFKAPTPPFALTPAEAGAEVACVCEKRPRDFARIVSACRRPWSWMEPELWARKAFDFVCHSSGKCKEKPKAAGVVEAFSRISAESVARQANGSTKR